MPLGHLPIGLVEYHDVTETGEYAFSIASETVPVASTPQEVECPAAKDLTLRLLGKAVSSGNWTSYNIRHHV